MGLISMRVKADTTMYLRYRGRYHQPFVSWQFLWQHSFFRAMMYIANAPNFMGKNIAAQADVEGPDFLAYSL